MLGGWVDTVPRQTRAESHTFGHCKPQMHRRGAPEGTIASNRVLCTQRCAPERAPCAPLDDDEVGSEILLPAHQERAPRGHGAGLREARSGSAGAWVRILRQSGAVGRFGQLQVGGEGPLQPRLAALLVFGRGIPCCISRCAQRRQPRGARGGLRGASASGRAENAGGRVGKRGTRVHRAGRRSPWRLASRGGAPPAGESPFSPCVVA